MTCTNTFSSFTGVPTDSGGGGAGPAFWSTSRDSSEVTDVSEDSMVKRRPSTAEILADEEGELARESTEEALFFHALSLRPSTIANCSSVQSRQTPHLLVGEQTLQDQQVECVSTSDKKLPQTAQCLGLSIISMAKKCYKIIAGEAAQKTKKSYK